MRLSLLSKIEDAHEDAVWTAAWAGPELLLTGDHQLLDNAHAANPIVIVTTSKQLHLPNINNTPITISSAHAPVQLRC